MLRTALCIFLMFAMSAKANAAKGDAKPFSPRAFAKSRYAGMEFRFQLSYQEREKESIAMIPVDKATDSNIQLLRSVLVQQTYQSAIDYVICAERAYPLGETFDEIGQLIDRCWSTRNSKSTEYFLFVSKNYDLIQLNRHALGCFAASELLEYEIEFPPYEFLRLNSKTHTAIDAEKFLECVRSRL
jgi:hypothetical protein